MTQPAVNQSDRQSPRGQCLQARGHRGLRRAVVGSVAVAALWLAAAGTASAYDHADSVDHGQVAAFHNGAPGNEHGAGFHNGAPGHEHGAGFHNGAPGHEHVNGFHHEAP